MAKHLLSFLRPHLFELKGHRASFEKIRIPTTTSGRSAEAVRVGATKCESERCYATTISVVPNGTVRRPKTLPDRVVRARSDDSKSGNDDNDYDNNDHSLFQKQLEELRREQEDLFGSVPNDANVPSPTTTTTTTTTTNEPRDSEDGDGSISRRRRSERMREEREDLFQFSNEERRAWGESGGIEHKHSESFLKELERARENVERGNGRGAKDNVVDVVVDEPASAFSHLTEEGDDVSMVDVGRKKTTRRTARARSTVVFPPEVVEAFDLQRNGRSEMVGPKGPIFATAKIAGIMGAKQTSNLIPLCHPLPLDRAHVEITLEGNVATIECECTVTHKTGVEMEALTGATVAALTIYDMVKAVSHNVKITETVLVAKSGGKREVKENKQRRDG